MWLVAPLRVVRGLPGHMMAAPLRKLVTSAVAPPLLPPGTSKRRTCCWARMAAGCCATLAPPPAGTGCWTARVTLRWRRRWGCGCRGVAAGRLARCFGPDAGRLLSCWWRCCLELLGHVTSLQVVRKYTTPAYRAPEVGGSHWARLHGRLVSVHATAAHGCFESSLSKRLCCHVT